MKEITSLLHGIQLFVTFLFLKMANPTVTANRARKAPLSDPPIIGSLEDPLFWPKIIKSLFINFPFFKHYKKFTIEGCDKEKTCYSIRAFNYK